MRTLHWRIPPDASLIWHCWPGEHEYVLYHGAANQTHQLAETAGLFLAFLASGESDPDHFQRMLRDEGIEQPEEVLAHILEALHQLDVIEPIDAA
jgi:hypothetical protein